MIIEIMCLSGRRCRNLQLRPRCSDGNESLKFESSQKSLMSSLESSHFVQATRVKLNHFYHDWGLSSPSLPEFSFV